MIINWGKRVGLIWRWLVTPTADHSFGCAPAAMAAMCGAVAVARSNQGVSMAMATNNGAVKGAASAAGTEMAMASGAGSVAAMESC